MARKNQRSYLEGAAELNNALRAVGNKASGLTLRKAALAGAEVIAAEAKALAPRDTGELAESITAKPGRVQAGRAQINIGYGSKQWYGQLVELGTKYMPARPFLRPAFDTKREEATKAVQDVLRDALKDVL